MPEYSSTTITPADAVQTPAMNGSTSGNYNLAALRSYILASKGQANGLASLDANGKLPSGQLPDLADDVLVYDSYATLPAQGESGKIYITADNNKMYRWDSNSSDYVELSVDLSAYATKAEVNALSARVSNLEQKAGDYSIVQYRGTNAVPTGKAKYGLVDKIVGKPRGWNQLAKAMNSTNWQFTNATGSFSDGVATFTATATRGKLNEHAVAFNAAHNARNRLPCLKSGGVFFPRSKQLAHGDIDAFTFAVDALDHHGDIHAAHESVARMRNARDRNAIYRQQRRHAASNIYKSTKWLKMRDLCH